MENFEPISTDLQKKLTGYFQIVDDSKKQMEILIGIPAHLIGASYDPVHKEASVELLNSSIVITRTLFDKVLNKLETKIIKPEQIKSRLPRKLKKIIKNRLGYKILRKYDYNYIHQVYKLLPYYGCSIKKERN